MIEKHTVKQLAELHELRLATHRLTDIVESLQEVRGALLRIESDDLQVDHDELEQQTDVIIGTIWKLRNSLEEHINMNV